MTNDKEFARIKALLDSLGDFQEDIKKTGADLGKLVLAQQAQTEELSELYSIVEKLETLVKELSPSQWMNTKECASYLAVSDTTLRKWREDGIIPCYKPAGSDWRYNKTEIDRAIEGRQQQKDGFKGKDTVHDDRM